MVYVGHMFRWKPDTPYLLRYARRWDYQWCRMWSDKSFAEMSEFFHSMRGKTWYWRQDGRSLPYYLITPEMRRRALARGAVIKDWNNPQLPDGVIKKHAKNSIEKERAAIAYQQETTGGTFSLLNTEEDILAATSVLRRSKPSSDSPPVHQAGNANPPHEEAGQAPV